MRTRRRNAIRVVLGVAVLSLLVAAPARAELTAQQKQFLKSVEQRLAQAKTNLKAAEEAAGPADKEPTQSRANLALSRAGSAKGQLKTVTDALKKLPADDETVKSLAEDAAEVGKAIDELETRLTGEEAADSPAHDAKGTKLDYKQDKLLKDAQFELAQIEGAAAALAKVVEQTKKAKDPGALDHRLLRQAMNTADAARERKKTLEGYLADLPADGAGVAAVAERLEETMAKVEAAAKALAPVNERLQKMADPDGYPKLKEDLERLGGLSAMFGDPINTLRNDPDRAAEAVRQADAAREEHARFVETYAPLVQQKTDAGKRIEGASRHFTEREKAFTEAAARRAKELPGELRAELEALNKTADEAVAEQKPLYFTGGIPQRLVFVEAKLPLLLALDPAGGKAIEAAVAETRASIKQKQGSLSGAIIAQNELPPDKYAGPDKADLAERATAAWTKVQPGAKVLAVRFPSERWERETMWRLQNRTFYKVDRSKLQAQLIVQHDDKLAVVRAINLWTDHLDGDAVSAIPLDRDAKAEPEPQDLIPLEKVK